MSLKYGFSGIILLILLGFLDACTPAPLQDTLLYGYRDGKRQMKYTTSIVVNKLENGDPGYLLKTHVNYSLGVKERMESDRSAWLRNDFTVEKVEVTRNYNGKIVQKRIYREGSDIVVWQKEGDAEPTEQKTAAEGPVFSDLHPLLYSEDLKKPGDQKVYAVLHDTSCTIKKVTIQYAGNPVMDINGERKATMNFKLEKMTEPGKYDDYYLDPKTREPLKIDYGIIQFVPGA